MTLTTDLVEDAINACRRAKAVLRSAAALRAVREAGARLLEVERAPGTSPRGETRYAQVVREAEISPATAARWQAVARVSDSAFGAYIHTCRKYGWMISIDGKHGLLTRTRTRTAPQQPTKAEERYAFEIQILGQRFGTTSRRDTEREAVRFAYEVIYRERCAERGAA